MSTEEQEITLVVQRDHLSTPELGHGWEEGSEQPSDVHSEQCGKVVQDELGGMRRWAGVTADLLTEDDAGQLEVGRGARGEVDDGNGIW